MEITLSTPINEEEEAVAERKYEKEQIFCREPGGLYEYNVNIPDGRREKKENITHTATCGHE